MSDDAKIIPITPKMFVEAQTLPPPNQDVIDRLQRLLDEAHTGKLQAFAYAGIDDQGWQEFSWKGNSKVSVLISAVTRLWYSLLKADHEQE